MHYKANLPPCYGLNWGDKGWNAEKRDRGPVGMHKRADFITKSRLKWLITQQDNKVRGDTQMLAKEIALFRKLADKPVQKGPKDFLLKGVKVWLVVANFLVPEFFYYYFIFYFLFSHCTARGSGYP